MTTQAERTKEINKALARISSAGLWANRSPFHPVELERAKVEKITEFKRRARMAVAQAREARELGDLFTAAYQLGYAARCRAAVAAINAR